MRGNIALVSLLTAGLLVGSHPVAGEPATARATELPQEVDGGVVVDLADGDRFKVTVSRDQRTVWGSRYDGATGAWGRRAVVLQKQNVYCGDVDARAAGTAVAVIAECDKGGWSEDQAPTHSQALYSPDTLTWQAFTLPGEAHEEPGISPSGANAIWPLHGGWVTRTAAGYRVVEHELPGQEYTVTGTISDAGDVSVLYGGARDSDGSSCVLSVLTVAASGTETGQQIDVENACADVDLSNGDATTVFFGENGYPESTVTLTRPDTASPWAVTGIAPKTAPGLVRHRGKGTATTLFPSSPGLPLLAVGSPDRKSFYAQTYDPVGQRWYAATRISSNGRRCTWGDNFIGEPLGVFALRLTCGQEKRVLVSVNGAVWHDVALGHSPLGVSPDAHYAAVSNRKRTLIFSRERGLVRLPLPTRAACDVIQPISPDAAIRLTSTNERGWPGRLDQSTASGWRRTTTTFPRLRVGTDRCTRADADVYVHPVQYSFYGANRAVGLTVAPSGDDWKVRRTLY